MPTADQFTAADRVRLEEFKRSLIQVRSIEDICDLVVGFLGSALQAGNIGIYLWNESEGAFTIWPEEPEGAERFMIYDPFLLHVSEDDRPVFANDLQNWKVDADVRSGAGRFIEATNADLVLPLALNQSVVGMIYASDLSRSTEDDAILPMLEEIRSLSVMALSNAILYKRLEGILEHLEEKVRDRTRELENAQSQLIQSEKMAMLGVMVAGIAHEVNTPASVIQGGVANIQHNLDFMMKTLRHPERVVPEGYYDQLLRVVRTIAVRVLAGKRSPVNNAFRLKRDLGEELKKRGVTEERELATFLVETRFYRGDSSDQIDRFFERAFMRNLTEISKAATPEQNRALMRLYNEVGNCARNLQNIGSSIRNISRIVKALKHYSHLDQGQMGESDLHEGIENTLIILSSINRHDVVVAREYGELPLVVCNPDELNQVWTNIITNAYQALKNEKQPEIRIATRLDSDSKRVHVEIQDNGPGIPADHLNRIWDPFFTTKDQGEGSGLGLGIVRGIVEKHNGSISVQSNPDEGTTFTVTLPVQQ